LVEMRRIPAFLKRIDIGFWLLIAASITLFGGALIADFNSLELRSLNTLHFPEWLSGFYDRPDLYLWILMLFAILFMLVVNTIFCTVAYIKNHCSSSVSFRKLSIIMFHVCFLLFLSGHFLNEFSGVNEILVLEKGTVTGMGAEGLTIEPLSIERESFDIKGQIVSKGVKTVLYVRDGHGKTSTIRLETLKPNFASGYSFHVSMKDRDLSNKQVRIVVRRDYGLYPFAIGGILTIMAIFLFVLRFNPSSSVRMAFQGEQ